MQTNYDNQIFEIYKDRGIYKYNELYLYKNDAIDCVKFCKENNLAVVGIEGFKIINNDIISQMDLITDCSDDRSKSWI